MPPTSTVALPLSAGVAHPHPRRAVQQAHRSALTAVLRPLALVAVAALAILHVLPAALRAAALQVPAGA